MFKESQTYFYALSAFFLKTEIRWVFVLKYALNREQVLLFWLLNGIIGYLITNITDI